MRISRYKKILSLISSSGPQSRTRLAEEFNITLSGTKRLVDELLEKGILERTGLQKGESGRPSELFYFNPGYGLLAAIEIGRTTSKAALFDLSNSMVEQHTCATDFSVLPRDFITGLWSRVSAWLALRPGHRLLSVGFAAGGVVSPARMTVAHLHPEKEWQAISLEGLHFNGHRPVVAPYAVAALTAEAVEGGLADLRDNALFFHFGSNVVGAVLIEGKIYENTNASHGHLGHMPLHNNTLRCYCGNTGCAETLISTEGMVAQFQRAVAAGAANTLGSAVTLPAMIKAAAASDRLCLRIFEEAARIAGGLLAGPVNLLSPRHVVLGGEIFFNDKKLGERLVTIIRNAIREQSFYLNAESLTVRTSRLGNDSLIAGAALCARNQWIENVSL